jgi:hypothetical protein
MGTSINDVPRFFAFFDLPTYLRPIWSHLEKAAYFMMSFFVWPTPPNFFLYSNLNYSTLRVGQVFLHTTYLDFVEISQVEVNFWNHSLIDTWQQKLGIAVCKMVIEAYCTRAIIIRFVYYLPTFWSPKTFFHGAFSLNFWPYVWLVFKRGF